MKDLNKLSTSDLKEAAKLATKQPTILDLRRKLAMYKDADALKTKAYALDHYGIATKKAFDLADRRWAALYKMAETVLGWSAVHHDDAVTKFIDANGEWPLKATKGQS